MKFSSWLKAHIYKYILLFCSHSLVFKCQPECSYQDQHFFFNSSMHPCESLILLLSCGSVKIARFEQKKFQLSTKLPLFRKRFYPNTLEQATFLPPDSDFCMLLWNITVCYFPLFADWFQSFLIFFFFFKSIRVLCLSIVLLWALEYLTFQRCCSSNAPRWLCFAWGCSHTSESYSAPKTAVGVTKSGVPSVY